MDDFVLNVRQIVQYPVKTVLDPTDLVLLQESDTTGLAAGAYKHASVVDFIGTALAKRGNLRLAVNNSIMWNGASLTFGGSGFSFTQPVTAPNFLIGTLPVATQEFVLEGDAALSAQLAHTVRSFNFRTGDVILEEGDILRAGGAPQNNPHLHGVCTAPSVWDERQNDDTIATVNWVHRAFQFDLFRSPVLLSPDCTQPAHPLSTADINAAYGVTNTFPAAPNPPLGDASNRIATTLFVDDSMTDLHDQIVTDILTTIDLSGYAKLDSPQFTGDPTAPTANPGTSTGQLATTAFVMHAVTASTTGVATWNTRTGAVVMTGGDISAAGGALLNSPIFTGVPTAPTAAPGNNSQQLATTAFVETAIAAIGAAGVSSFNTRTGAVVLTTADVTGAGGAPLASPALTGTPTSPTVAQTDNSTTIATTSYVRTAIAALPAPVTSFNGRTGAITLQGSDVSAAGGALVASPTFTGTPAAPTATAGTNTTQLATTAFVQAAIAATGAGVVSFNGRSGAVTLISGDVTGAGGALLASPGFTGTPTAPTAAQASNDTTLATTAFVHAAIAAVNTGVISFNGRSGAVTLQGSDVSAAGGALLASPTFTGTPQAPTPVTTSNDTSIATTAWVTTKLGTAGGVTSFNGRAGAVTLTSADITGAGGALAGQAAPVTYAAQVFAATGTFTTAANSTTATVYRARMVAGGGGGGGMVAGATVFALPGAGGAFAEFIFSGVAPSTALPVTIGAGGTAGPATGTADGGNGGNSVLNLSGPLGVTVTCNGGALGHGTATVYFPPAKGGTVAVTGTNANFTMLLAMPGEDSTPSDSSYSGLPHAGGSAWGFGAADSPMSPVSQSTGYGSGGACAVAAATAGQAGRPGLMIIERMAG